MVRAGRAAGRQCVHAWQSYSRRQAARCWARKRQHVHWRQMPRPYSHPLCRIHTHTPDGVLALAQVPNQAQAVGQRPRGPRQRRGAEAKLLAPPAAAAAAAAAAATAAGAAVLTGSIIALIPAGVSAAVVDGCVGGQGPLQAGPQDHSVQCPRQVAPRGVAAHCLMAFHCRAVGVGCGRWRGWVGWAGRRSELEALAGCDTPHCRLTRDTQPGPLVRLQQAPGDQYASGHPHLCGCTAQALCRTAPLTAPPLASQPHRCGACGGGAGGGAPAAQSRRLPHPHLLPPLLPTSGAAAAAAPVRRPLPPVGGWRCPRRRPPPPPPPRPLASVRPVGGSPS